MMHVLVTGGGGYLGSWVTRLLLEGAHRVRVLDRFSYRKEVFNDIPPGHLEIREGDIRHLHELPGLLTEVDAIIHLASLSNDPSCDLDTDAAFDVNVDSTRELARHASEAGVSRFVFGSSCKVYGHGVFEILDEASPANPVSTFGETKLAAEQVLLRMADSSFEPVIARTATMYGWSERMRFDLAINLMVATAARQGKIVVSGGGRQWRPFVHVRDTARALILMAQAPADQVAGQIFNVGAPQENIQIGVLAERVAAALGNVTVNIAQDDDDRRTYRVQFDKLARVLNFTPEVTIDEGIAEVHRMLQETGVDPSDEVFSNAARLKTLRATPVDEGGEPVAPRFIPLSLPSIGVEEETAVLDALRSGWLTSGPKIGAFEKQFAQFVQAKHCVALSSCTAALHLCLVEMGVKTGDEVITSPITWASTGNTILNMGAKVVFVDVDPKTLNLDPALLEAAITERTKVIMPVHLAGHPCDMDAIQAVADKHGIPVVEDAAHALGAAYKGTPIGGLKSPACFSFYAIKNITTMEGGIVSLPDPERAAHLRFLATNGMSATAWDRYGRSAIIAPQEVVSPGYKYAMGNVSAAMGLEQIRKFPDFMTARRRLAEMYRAVLADIDEIELPEVVGEVDHAWHLYVIRFRLDKLKKSRDELAYDLRRENVGSGIHFYGLHLHRYYREALGMTPEMFPEATKASSRILSLPLHPRVTDKQIHEVVTALKKVVLHARK